MLKIVLVATLFAAVAAQYPNSIDSGYGAPGGRGGGGAGGAGGRASSPIESDPNLELENEGLNLPSDIIGQDLLDRVVDAVSRDLAEQEAAGNAARAAAAAASGAYGAPVGSAYGPPSGAYGAPSTQYGPGGAGGRDGAGGPGAGGSGADNYGQITLLIPPDPLKARLIANYIQRTTGPYTPRNNGANGQGYSGNNGARAGGY